MGTGIGHMRLEHTQTRFTEENIRITISRNPHHVNIVS